MKASGPIYPGSARPSVEHVNMISSAEGVEHYNCVLPLLIDVCEVLVFTTVSRVMTCSVT
jgi:hypothetical protein